MDSPCRPDSSVAISAFLEAVRKKGVELWSHDCQLHFRAPKGALTSEEIARIRACKDQIVVELARRDGASTLAAPAQRQSQSYRAPLTFSQLERWNHNALGQSRSVRQVASVMALRGQLSVEALRASIAQLIHRHDALRSRIVVRDGLPMQEVEERWAGELEVEDWAGLPGHVRAAQSKRLIDELVLQPIDVNAGPLFGVRLARLGEKEHVLALAMEHIISDGVSLGIVERDLLGLYARQMTGGPCTLPPMAMQFADYAVWQRSTHAAWLQKHAHYWRENVLGRARTRFPADARPQPGERPGWGIVPFEIGPERTRQLREWCRSRRTTLVMAVFTAYVASVLRWCGVWDTMVRYQSDGRFDSRIAETVGYFAAVLYVRIEAHETDTLLDLMQRATHEYCTAYEHADSSSMTGLFPRSELARNSSFNWLPRMLPLASATASGSLPGLMCAPIAFEHPMLRHMDVDSEPSVLFREMNELIAGEIYFPRSRFSPALIGRFGATLLSFVEALLYGPQTRIRDVAVPAG